MKIMHLITVDTHTQHAVAFGLRRRPVKDLWLGYRPNYLYTSAAGIDIWDMYEELV